MTTTHLHPLAEDYLARLGAAARALPPHEAEELIAELRGHLAAGLSADPTDAEVRNLLAELGPPEAIVAEAGGGTTPWLPPAPTVGPRTSPWGVVEVLAVLGLTVGTFVLPFVGPLIGLVLAWVSDQWTRREKWVATVLTLASFVVVVLGLVAVFAPIQSDNSTPPTPVVQHAKAPARVDPRVVKASHR